ncbi:MAG: hypothetical protein JWO13_828 [Acidobacteriales bacterium]|nr:hypothetical protein [Terriglobales bacterium]
MRNKIVAPDVERFNPAVINGAMKNAKRLGFNSYGRGFKNPIIANIQDVLNQPVYDSFTVAANTAFPKTTLFQSPISGTRTLAQTNMQLAGQLPAPQRLVVRAIKLIVANNTTLTDLVNILENVSVVFTVGKKPWFEGPAILLTAGCGAQMVSAAQVGTAPAGTAVAFSTSNGSVDQRAAFTLSQPVVIEAGETFSVTLQAETGFSTQANTTNPPGVGTTVRVVLDGELYRGVQ